MRNSFRALLLLFLVLLLVTSVYGINHSTVYQPGSKYSLRVPCDESLTEPITEVYCREYLHHEGELDQNCYTICSIPCNFLSNPAAIAACLAACAASCYTPPWDECIDWVYVTIYPCDWTH